MTPYEEFLDKLKSCADENYKNFHKRLLKNDDINVIGVRVSLLRKLAKEYKSDIDGLLSFPDDYYEVTFVKLTAVSLFTYEKFIVYSDKCVSLIDNWATCDCFTPKCIEKHKDEFLPFIFKYVKNGNGEFYQRFALTTLLHFYVEEKYLKIIFDKIKETETEKYYYVHMAAAWLLAEVLVKYYDEGVSFLKANFEVDFLDKKTHNKAIQKACESYRLSAEQKTYLKGLKK